MKHFLFLLLLSSLIIRINSQSLRKVICGNGNVTEISPGELVLFESPNYPKKIENKTDCSAIFTRKDSSTKGFVFTFTNGYTSNFIINEDNGDNNIYDSTSLNDNILTKYIANVSTFNYTYATNVNSSSEWEAFQATVYAPLSSSDTCIFNNTVLNFTNNNEIIPVNFTSVAKFLKNYNCIVQFTLPEGYYLKINTVKLILDYDDVISVSSNNNSEKVIMSTGVTKYFGKKITLKYQQTFTDGKEKYYGLISIEKNEILIDKNCVTVENDENMHVSNFDPINGYPYNSICSSPVNLADNKIYSLEFKKKFVERDADKVFAKFSSGEKSLLSPDLTYTVENGLLNNTINGVEFTSDGSVNDAGFSFDLIENECQCKNTTFIPSCDPISQEQLLTSLPSYCSNMQCTFTFGKNLSCPKEQLYIDFHVKLRSLNVAYDILTVYLNGSKEFEFRSVDDDSVEFNKTLNFYSNDIVTLELNTSRANRNVYPSPFINFDYYSVNSSKFYIEYIYKDILAYNLYTTNYDIFQIYKDDLIPRQIQMVVACDEKTVNDLKSIIVLSDMEKIRTLYDVYRRFYIYNEMTTSNKFNIVLKNKIRIAATIFFRYANIYNDLSKDRIIVPSNIYQEIILDSHFPINSFTFLNYGEDENNLNIRLNFTSGKSKNYPLSIVPQYRYQQPLLKTKLNDNLTLYQDITLKGLYNTIIVGYSDHYRVEYQKVDKINFENPPFVPMKGILYTENYGRNEKLSNNSAIIGVINNPENAVLNITLKAMLTTYSYIKITQGNDVKNLTYSKPSILLKNPGKTVINFISNYDKDYGLIHYEIKNSSYLLSPKFIYLIITAIISYYIS